MNHEVDFIFRFFCALCPAAGLTFALISIASRDNATDGDPILTWRHVNVD
jgi:hypothetical protein